MFVAQNIKISMSDQGTLEHLSNILHLFHHRNKNQHRRSIWWRHFSVFRRQLNALLEEVAKLNAVPTTHLERVRKKATDKDVQAKIAQRLDFWQTVLVVKWQDAFSQLVADGRFAVSGLVLLAVLAQICRITGIIGAFEEIGQAEVEKVLHQFGNEDWEDDLQSTKQTKAGQEDVGEVVLREIPQPEEDASEEVLAALPMEGHAKSSKRSGPTRKKRRKANAIDDLFSGLG